MAVSIIVGAQISSRILQKTGIRSLLFVGTLMATLGFFWLSLIHTHSPYFTGVMLPACTCALAMGLLFSPLATAATSGIERSDAGVASGLLNTARQVGGSLALAALATIATSRSNSFASPFSPAAQTSGYQRAFQISAAITLLAFLGSWLMPKRAGLAADATPAIVE
jgi:MFS family permease